MRLQYRISQTKHEVFVWDHITLFWAYKHTQSHVKHQERRHINFFLKISIQEGIFNIKLRNMSLTNRSYGNKSTNSSYFCNRGKYLLIIHTILLRVSFCNQPNFISLNKPIKTNLDLIHLTTTNNTLVKR